MSKMVYLLVASAVFGIAYAGWKLSSRSAYESAAYSVFESEGKIEVREYPDLMLASTDTNSRQGNDGSFGRLFQYISGENEAEQKIAMTTPVFMESDSSKGRGTMSFVLPDDVATGSIPIPANERVQIDRRQGGLFAVIRFAGRDGKDLFDAQNMLLRQWIEQRGYEVDGEPEFAGYDPPWIPGPLRRNEILIRIRKE